MAAVAGAEDAMSPSHRTRVLESLEKLQGEHDRIITEMRNARRLIAKRARDLVEPLLEARRALIEGSSNAIEADAVASDAKSSSLAGFAVPPSPSAAEETDEAAGEAAASAEAADGDAAARKPFDAFWMTVLAQHPIWAEMMQEKDEDALRFLVDCRVSMNEDWTGFALEWRFRENPFFSNEVLTKTIVFSGEVDVENDLSVKSISGTKINWKAGKQLTLRKPKRRTRGGGGRRGRGRREPEPEEKEDPSVFCYFERELDPAALMAKQLGEDEMEELHEQVSMDIQAAEVLRESLAPRAVKWFLGEEGVEDSDDEGYFEAEAGDDDGDDDEDEEDGDDEGTREAMRSALASAFGTGAAPADGEGGSGDAPANPFASGGNPFASGGDGAGADGEEKPECKQQ